MCPLSLLEWCTASECNLTAAVFSERCLFTRAAAQPRCFIHSQPCVLLPSLGTIACLATVRPNSRGLLDIYRRRLISGAHREQNLSKQTDSVDSLEAGQLVIPRVSQDSQGTKQNQSDAICIHNILSSVKQHYSCISLCNLKVFV